VIELLGIGVPDEGGGWLLHRICAHLDRGGLTAVVAGRRAEGRALLDAISGHRIPDEGRVWVDRIPLMRETVSRVRAVVTDAGPAARFTDYRSVLWNTLVTPSAALSGLLRFPRRAERAAATRTLAAVGLEGRWRDTVASLSALDRARLALARALMRRPRAFVLRDVDGVLGPDDATALLTLARGLAHAERLAVVASLASEAVARAAADRVIVLADGLLLFDGPVGEFTDEVARRRRREVIG
jgi:ABC-type phosphate/phosphonate transport system ATPase subunit